jgi:hypothetical protein
MVSTLYKATVLEKCITPETALNLTASALVIVMNLNSGLSQKLPILKSFSKII